MLIAIHVGCFKTLMSIHGMIVEITRHRLLPYVAVDGRRRGLIGVTHNIYTYLIITHFQESHLKSGFG